MNKGLSSRNGFTLLELLVVIIIVGVLAAVAMPTLFRNIERSRSAEAMTAMGLIHRAAKACMTGKGTDYCQCIDNLYGWDGWASIGMQNPGTQPGAHFTYTFGPIGAATVDCGIESYSITARRNTLENGNTNDFLTMNYLNGSVVITGGNFAGLGTGAFEGMSIK